MKSTLLEKSFRILEKIASAHEPVTLKELAADLELNTSTVSRITSDLTARKLICKSGYHSFVPAIGLLRLGRAAWDTPMIRAVKKVMDERLEIMGASGVFAGIDNGEIIHLYEKDCEKGEWLPARLPLWRSNLAAVILGKRGDREEIERFFRRSWQGTAKGADAGGEFEALCRRCSDAARDGYMIFKDPRLGWSINFPVVVPGEVYGISVFSRDTEHSTLDFRQFECSRLASRLSSVLGEMFY